MQQWWLAAVGALIGGAGYVLRRLIEGSKRKEVLKQRLQALALLRGMRQTGASLRDLDRLAENR